MSAVALDCKGSRRTRTIHPEESDIVLRRSQFRLNRLRHIWRPAKSIDGAYVVPAAGLDRREIRLHRRELEPLVRSDYRRHCNDGVDTVMASIASGPRRVLKV